MASINRLRNFFTDYGVRRYFFNTGWLLAEKIIRLVVSLFVSIYVARYLGPSKFGILSFALSFVALFGAFAKLGLDGIVVRNAVQEPGELNELLGTAFGLRLVGGGGLLMLVYIAIQLTNSDSLTQFMVMIIAVGYVLQAVQVIEFYFQSQVLARFVAIAGIISLLVSSGVKLVLIWSGASLVWFAWVFVIEFGLKGVMLLVFYFKQDVSSWPWLFRVEQVKSLLRDSWPLILSGFVVMVYMRIDQVMIKIMLDAEAVGNYAAAVQLSEAWYFVPVVICQSLFPAILSSKKKSHRLYHNRLQSLYNLMVWLAICLAIPTTLLSNWVIVFLYGHDYSQAGTVLSIHIWAAVFVFVGVASGKWLISENLQIFSFIRAVLGAITNIMLNFLLIPKLGIIGAAISTFVSQMIASYLSFSFTRKTFITFKMQTRSFFWPIRKILSVNNEKS